MRKLSSWKGSSLSIAGRIVLINSSLSSTFIYHMSMYLLPKTISHSLDKQRRRFLWQGNNSKKKYHLVRWETMCKSKSKGGLGIKNIWKMNISLLSKWWWKLETEDGLWQRIVKAKYLSSSSPIGAVKHRLYDSPLWSDLLKIRHIYMKKGLSRSIMVNQCCFGKNPGLKISLSVSSTQFFMISAKINSYLCIRCWLEELNLTSLDGFPKFFLTHGSRLCMRSFPSLLTMLMMLSSGKEIKMAPSQLNLYMIS